MAHRFSSSRSSSSLPSSLSSSSFRVRRCRERLSRKWATHLNTLWQSRLALEVWDSTRAEEGATGASKRGERPDNKKRNGDKRNREKDGEGEDSLLLVRHRSVVLQGAHGAFPRGSSRDRSKSRFSATQLARG